MTNVFLIITIVSRLPEEVKLFGVSGGADTGDFHMWFGFRGNSDVGITREPERLFCVCQALICPEARCYQREHVCTQAQMCAVNMSSCQHRTATGSSLSVVSLLSSFSVAACPQHGGQSGSAQAAPRLQPCRAPFSPPGQPRPALSTHCAQLPTWTSPCSSTCQTSLRSSGS